MNIKKFINTDTFFRLFFSELSFFLFFAFIAALAVPVLFTGCQTNPKTEKESASEPKELISRQLLENGKLNAFELTEFFIANNPESEYESILNFAYMYVEEAAAEGINSDVAFAQMCLETGFLRFGGLVQPDFHNYCGLGAMDKEHPGEKFETEQDGIRAHIQHLQAYATTEDIKLNQTLIDPRYNWVHKTKFVEDIWGLAGTWASDPAYGKKLDTILCRMEEILK